MARVAGLSKPTSPATSEPDSQEQPVIAVPIIPAQKESKPFEHTFFSSAVTGIVTVIILSEILPAATIALLGGLWGLLAIVAGEALLFNTILWLTLWAVHLNKENNRPKTIPSPTPIRTSLSATHVDVPSKHRLMHLSPTLRTASSPREEGLSLS